MIAIQNLCEQVPELLFLREHGQLTPEQALALEDHLRSCERCRFRQEELARARETVRALGGGFAGAGAAAKTAPPVSPAQRIAGLAVILLSIGAAAWGITRTVTPARIGSIIAGLRERPPAATSPRTAASRPAQDEKPPPAGRVVRSEPIPWSEQELGSVRSALAAGAYHRRLDPTDGAYRDLDWLLPGVRDALGPVRIVYLGTESSVVEFPRKDGRGTLRLTLEPLIRDAGRSVWFTVLVEEVEPPATAKP